MFYLYFWKFSTFWFCSFFSFRYLFFKPDKTDCTYILPLKSISTLSTKFNHWQTYAFALNDYYIKYFQYLIITWTTLLSIKVKFRHKISWIKMYMQKMPYILIDTNKSHYLILFMQNFYLKRRKKYFTYNTLLVKGTNFFLLKNATDLIVSSFPWDKYTSRGFRLARQKLHRRPGKISQYSMLKTKIF